MMINVGAGFQLFETERKTRFLLVSRIITS
jgi:hypothetical protein